MTLPHAKAEELVAKYEAGIREMRDQRGDDRCWKDLEKLYALLPEGYVPPQRDESVEIENCIRYIRSCHDPRTTYVSPQRRIEELEEQVRALQAQVKLLKDYRAAVSQTGFVIRNILNESQLDERTPCGITIRNYLRTLDAIEEHDKEAKAVPFGGKLKAADNE